MAEASSVRKRKDEKRSKRPTGSGSKQSGSKKTGLPNSKQFDRLYLVAVIALGAKVFTYCMTANK